MPNMGLGAIHSILANTLLIYTLVMSVWSLWIYARRRNLGSQYWGALVLNELVFIFQLLIGALMVFQGRVPPQVVHYLYGFLSVITLPSAFAFTRGRGTYREALIYGVLMLFMAGLVLRAKMTA